MCFSLRGLSFSGLALEARRSRIQQIVQRYKNAIKEEARKGTRKMKKEKSTFVGVVSWQI